MPGSIQMTPASPALNSTCRPFSCDNATRIGSSLAWKSCCSSCCRFVELRLRVLLEPLSLDGLPFDFLLELCARGVAHHAAACLQFCLIRLKRLGFVSAFSLFLLCERVDFRGCSFAFGRHLCDRLKVDESRLGARGKWRLRRKGRRRGLSGSSRRWCRRARRRLRGWRGTRGGLTSRLSGGLGESRRCAQHERERSKNRAFHYDNSFRQQRIERFYQKVVPTANLNWKAFCG